MEELSRNARLAIRGLAAYQQGDEETLKGFFDPGVEIYSEPGMINSGSFSGWDGFQQWISQWEEAWEEMSYEPIEFIDVSDELVVARVRTSGKGAGSGLEIDREFSYLWEIRDDRAIRFHLYGSPERAMQAARSLAGEGA